MHLCILIITALFHCIRYQHQSAPKLKKCNRIYAYVLVYVYEFHEIFKHLIFTSYVRYCGENNLKNDFYNTKSDSKNCTVKSAMKVNQQLLYCYV